MNYEELLSRAAEMAKRETGPKIDVAGDVMRIIRHKKTSTANLFERQLWFDAAVALALATVVSIPAQRAVQTLLDPMVDMFALVERSLL